MNHETETTHHLERDDGTILVLTLRGDVEPFVAGNRRGHPDSWEPDEGGTASVRSAVDEDGEERIGDLGDHTDELEQALIDHEAHRDEMAAESDAEDRAEQRAWDRAHGYD